MHLPHLFYLTLMPTDFAVESMIFSRKMRFSGKGIRTEEPVLAIGQKAAYFSGTGKFVNIVAGGGAHGFEGIIRMSEWMIDAFRNEKNTPEIIKLKGLGCESCLS